MPRIPTVTGGGRESTTTGIITPGQASLPFRQLAQNIDRFAVVQARVAAAEQASIDNLNKTRAMIAGDEGLFQLRTAALTSEDFENAPRIYRESAEKLINATVSRISNPEDQADVLFSLRRKMDTMGQAVSASSRTRVTGANVANLDVYLDNARRHHAQLIPGDSVDELARRAIQEEAALRIDEVNASGDITDGEAVKQDFLAGLDEDDARRDIFDDPVRAYMDLRENPEKYPNLLQSKRLTLENTAERAIASEGADVDRSDRLAREAFDDKSEQIRIKLINLLDEGGDFSRSELTHVSPHLTDEDFTAVRSVIISRHGLSDRSTFSTINEDIDAEGADFRAIQAQIYFAEGEGSLVRQEADLLLTRNRSSNGEQIDLVETTGARDIKEALGPIPLVAEGREVKVTRQRAGLAAYYAIISDIPADTPQAERDKIVNNAANNVITRFGFVDLQEQEGILPSPYGFGARLTFTNLDIQQRKINLKNAYTRLGDDLSAGIIGRGQYENELVNLQQWLSLTGRQEKLVIDAEARSRR